jgi:hypothetical protein
MRFGAALLFCLISTSADAQQFATVTTNAPIDAAPRETPTPLRVAAVGTRLRVIATDGDWAQVEYNDPQLGRSIGWVLPHYISRMSDDLRPMDLSVPDAPAEAPRTTNSPEPPSAVPMTSAVAFPRAETALGWSVLHVSSEFLELNSVAGWTVSVAGNVSPRFGIVGDVTGNYRTGSTVIGVPDVSIHTFAGGPRFSARTSSGAVPFAEFLVGFTRTSVDIGDDGEGSTEFTIQPGGGVDIGNERVAAPPECRMAARVL